MGNLSCSCFPENIKKDPRSFMVDLSQDSNNYSPILVCPSKYIIEENIGLISAEEVVLAGGAYKKSNTAYFLYNSSIPDYYWTLSPAYYDPTHKN